MIDYKMLLWYVYLTIQNTFSTRRDCMSMNQGMLQCSQENRVFICSKSLHAMYHNHVYIITSQQFISKQFFH